MRSTERGQAAERDHPGAARSEGISDFYLDSSALAKRYLSEIGTRWLRAMVVPSTSNTIWLAEITRVEVAAALAARHRAPRGITRQERDRAVRLLRQHSLLEYQLVSATPAILDEAVELTQRYRLRGYDAVRLATALSTNAALLAAGLSGPIFIAADDDLIAAARAEGLAADDPNLHP